MILPELTHSTVTVTHRPQHSQASPDPLSWEMNRTGRLSFQPQHYHLRLYSQQQLPVEFSSTEDQPNPSELQVELRMHLARPMRKLKKLVCGNINTHQQLQGVLLCSQAGLLSSLISGNHSVRQEKHLN